jgi:hypothetical protein
VKHRSIGNFQNDMEGILRLIDAGAGGGVLMNQGVRGEQLQKVGDLGQDPVHRGTGGRLLPILKIVTDLAHTQRILPGGVEP